MVTTTIKISVYTNGDDAFVAWAPSQFIPDCRGFMLERGRKTGKTSKVDIVDNLLGFAKDKPKSGDHEPSDVWPFQRFNWTDHAVDVGNTVRYRVTAMISADAKKPFTKGPASKWTSWASLSTDCGDGFSCYFNRGLVLSQFVARYLLQHKLTPAQFKAQLQKSTDPVFRAFLQGDLGARMEKILSDSASQKTDLHAALYELDDAKLESEMIAAGKYLDLILANGSGGTTDGNAAARKELNEAGIPTIDRLLGSKGLGHNKFMVLSSGGKQAVWTGSTNWSTTGLCTQINNGLLIENAKIAKLYLAQWNRLKDASPPVTNPASFTPDLIAANDQSTTFSINKIKVTVQFTPTSKGVDLDLLKSLISGAKSSILFLMFEPGKNGLDVLAGQRANDPKMYVRGVVSTLGDESANVLNINLTSSDQKFKPDQYTVVQPQGDAGLGPWIAETTRKDFISQIGYAIVHSKVMVIDHQSDSPILITGSHNFSASASKKNDENLVVITGHKPLAAAYAVNVMSVYAHYRYRSYIRQMEAEKKTPWSYLDDDDQWLKEELISKAQEIAFWT